MRYKYGDLKDCPSCDNSWGRPVVERNSDGLVYVQCANPHCCTSTGWCDTEAEAKAAWNVRPTEYVRILTLGMILVGLVVLVLLSALGAL